MNRVGAITATAIASLVVLGCTRDDDSLKEKLEAIDKRLAGIEKAITRGAAAGGARGARAERGQRQQPKGPNPKLTYSVPIEGAAYEGSRDAKITVVEAFEFA